MQLSHAINYAFSHVADMQVSVMFSKENHIFIKNLYLQKGALQEKLSKEFPSMGRWSPYWPLKKPGRHQYGW